MTRLLIAGGGTGGHLFPGVAIAEELRAREPAAEITFVGTKRGIEARVLPELGWPLELIEVSGLKTVGALGAVRGLFRLPRAYWQARRLLKRLRPDAVIGVGGYASGPVVLAAKLRGIPTAICEQNSIPGLTNKLLGRIVRRVFVAFDGSRRFFAPNKVALVGNPVRRELAAKLALAAPDRNERSFREGAGGKFAASLPDKPDKPDTADAATTTATATASPAPVHVLVSGGSLGAVAVNALAAEALCKLADERPLAIVHQTGEQDLEVTRKRYADAGVTAECRAFIKDMAAAYADAELVIGRAGATTVAELAIAGKPAVFIPYPFAADNHQELNAREMAEQGAALMFKQSELTADKLADALRPLLADPAKRAAMGQVMRSLAKPGAAAAVVDWATASSQSPA